MAIRIKTTNDTPVFTTVYSDNSDISKMDKELGSYIASAQIPALMNAFWASENRDAFIVLRSSQPGNSARKTLAETIQFGGQSTIQALKWQSIMITRRSV
jgi:hypothetical protein